MTLDFVLLIVDDAPDLLQEALQTLREYLDERGFSLDDQEATDFSEEGLEALAGTQGSNYDLVMVDYHLGPPDENGAIAARRLRSSLQYTDMVFYSSDPEAELFNELAQQRVAGVFVAAREDLAEALTGLADTVIRKTVDLNHMRGIAMAAVAEMDTMMEETLRRAVESGSRMVQEAAGALAEEIRGNLGRDVQWLEARAENGEFLEVVSNSRLFTFAHKYRLVRRIGGRLAEPPNEVLEQLRPFADDIGPRRNKLAHVKAETTEDGKLVLRSVKPGQDDVMINEAWMEEFRGLLKRYRPALASLCGALDRQLGGGQAETEAQED